MRKHSTRGSTTFLVRAKTAGRTARSLLIANLHRRRFSENEELRDGEHDVNSLQEALGISHSGVSQHLMVMRANRLVSERREGRRVFYQLRQPAIAGWLLEATRFLEKGTTEADELRKAIGKTRKDWA